MTIVVAVKVADGAVVGSDSMTHVETPTGATKAYAHSPKVFQLCNRPFFALFYGQGAIGDSTVGDVARTFSRDHVPPEPFSAQELALAFFAECRTRYNAAWSTGGNSRPRLGVVMVGYSEGASAAEGYEFELPRHTAVRQIWAAGQREGGYVFRGVEAPLTRLFGGIDPRVPPLLLQEGLSDGKINEIRSRVTTAIQTWGMPVVDAVGFVRFMLNTTIGYADLEPDLPLCGGPLQVALLRPGEDVSWIDTLPL